MRSAVPLILAKTFVHGYVTKDGKQVEGHEDMRLPAKRPEPAGEGGNGLKRTPPKDRPAPEGRMPGPKKYAAAEGGYRVGQRIRVKGHDGLYEVTKVSGAVAWATGPDGTIEVKQPGGAPMAKSLPLLLLKAAPPAPGAKPKAKDDKAKDKKKPAADAAAPGSAGPKGQPVPQKPSMPPKGAPDGEHTMEHQDRVAFQHGKVRGEGVIVASGADGVMVLDDAGREHPVRHDNLLGTAEDAECPDELPKDENGKPVATDAQAAGGAAAAAAKPGDAKDPKAKGADPKAAGQDMGQEATEGAGIEALASMDPGTLGKIMQALKVLAPLFGSSASKDAASAKKKAPAA